MDMLTGPLCRDHAIGDLESILSAGVRGQEGDEGDQPGETRTEFAARELSTKGRVRPCDVLLRLEFGTNFLQTVHFILPYCPVELVVRISQGGSRERQCSLSKLHSECPGFAAVGPCGAILRTAMDKSNRRFRSRFTTFQ